MYKTVLQHSVIQLRHVLAVQQLQMTARARASGAGVHTSAVVALAAKKTTSAAGGVMGLGKGKKKGGKLMAVEKKEMPVESDPDKLVHYVCGSNIYTTGEDVKLGPDSDYPSWLWSLRTGAAPSLQELDPTTKKYWLRVRTEGMRRNNRLKSMRKF